MTRLDRALSKAPDAEQAAEQTKQEKLNLLHVMIGGKPLLLRSSEIREVVRPVPLTSVPMGPDHVVGLGNIHGQIVCIIDVGGMTTLPRCSREQTARTRFLILKHAVMHVGIWVDEVCGIKQVQAASLSINTGDTRFAQMAQVDIDGVSFELLECACLLD